MSLKEKNITIVQGAATDLPPVVTDPEQLKQVLINLLNNAAEATPNGGEIHIVTTVEKEADGRSMVVVRISDSGCGMDEDVQRRVFEPFFSTKEEGTGLGLCIAARIMAAQDGLLVLESSSEKGTTFAVWTPIAQASELNMAKILVVDDEPTVCQRLRSGTPATEGTKS